MVNSKTGWGGVVVDAVGCGVGSRCKRRLRSAPPFTSTQGEFIIMLGKPGRYVNTIC